mgnify:CR=1 FL=1
MTFLHRTFSFQDIPVLVQIAGATLVHEWHQQFGLKLKYLEKLIFM